MKYEKGSFITVPSREGLRGLNPIAQALYLWLCSYANETGNCFPSRSRLAEDVGCSDRTIDNMIDLLIERGLVKKQHRIHEGVKLTNYYTVIVSGVANHVQYPPEPASVGVAKDVRIELNPVLTQPNELKYEIVSEPQKKQRTDLIGFESWWSIWPRKENKMGASAEWRKLSPEDRAGAIRGAGRVAQAKVEYQFIPMPHKWLENRRWEDELPVKKEMKSYG